MTPVCTHCRGELLSSAELALGVCEDCRDGASDLEGLLDLALGASDTEGGSAD